MLDDTNGYMGDLPAFIFEWAHSRIVLYSGRREVGSTNGKDCLKALQCRNETQQDCTTIQECLSFFMELSIDASMTK